MQILKIMFFVISCIGFYLYTERNGLRYDHNTGKVYDPKVKGKCVLVYKVHKI